MKRFAPWLLLVLALAGVAGFFGWAFYASGGLVGAGDEGMTLVWIIFVAGVLVTGGLTGLFMWLAFFSSRRGYDEQFDVNAPRGHPTGGTWRDKAERRE